MPNQKDRVLSRLGARQITEEELNSVGGGIHTLTPCTVDHLIPKDGDAGIPGEC